MSQIRHDSVLPYFNDLKIPHEADNPNPITDAGNFPHTDHAHILQASLSLSHTPNRSDPRTNGSLCRVPRL